MKQIRKSHIFSFILGAIIFSGVTVLANNYLAKDISFTPKNTNWKKEDGTDITNVKDALDELYDKNMTIAPLISDSNGNFFENDGPYIGERNSISVPNGTKKMYILYSNGTDESSLSLNFQSDLVISSTIIGANSGVDTYSRYALRSSLVIYKLELTGEEGTIKLSVSGGAGDRRAWTVLAMY